MRDGWSETTLDGIAEYINGYPFKPADLGETGVPVIRIKQLLDPNEPVDRTETETPERCLLSNGDIVFSWSGTLAVRIWNRGPAKLNQHLFRVVEKDGVYKGIIPLILDHAIEELEEKSHGTTMKHITKQTLLPHKVLLPPLPEQKRIVDLISSVDSYIEALKHQERSARDALKALSQRVFSSIDDLVELSAIATCVMGQSPEGSTCNKNKVGTPLLTGPTEFQKNNTVGEPRQWTTVETKISLPEDILFCVRGATAGRMNLATYRSVIGRGLAAIRCEDSLDTHYVRIALQFGLHQLLPAAGGTIFPNISQAQLRNFMLPWPNPDDRKSSANLLLAAEEMAKAISHTVLEATNARSGLLSQLLSGKHEIPASYDKVIGAA